MDAWKAATMMLEEHGGWGVAVVLAFALWRMWIRNNKREDEHREDDRKSVKILEGFKAAVEALTKAVDRLADKKPGG